MKKQKTAPAESAVQTEKKGTGIQIDKKTVFGITALLLVIMLLAGVLTQVVPRGEYQMDDSGMVGISYGKYLRWSWKLFVMEFGLAALAMLGAVAIGY